MGKFDTIYIMLNRNAAKKIHIQIKQLIKGYLKDKADRI